MLFDKDGISGFCIEILDGRRREDNIEQNNNNNLIIHINNDIDSYGYLLRVF